MTLVLGIGGGGTPSRDAAACLVDDAGRVLALVAEERVAGARCGSWPRRAVERCLELADTRWPEVTVVAVGRRLPHDSPVRRPVDLLERIGAPSRELGRLKVEFVGSHEALIAAAVGCCGAPQAAVLVADAAGEDGPVSLWRWQEGQAQRLEVWPQTCSPGQLMDETARWMGPGITPGAVADLAAYGAHMVPPDPGWLRVGDDGMRSLLGADARINHAVAADLWQARIAEFAGSGPRPDRPARQLPMDRIACRVAAAAQTTVARVMQQLAARARRLAGTDVLCVAGSMARNEHVMGRLERPLFTAPVPDGARGAALGAAWTLSPPSPAQLMDPYRGSYAGLPPAPATGRTREATDPARVAELLASGQLVGVAWGRSEAGTRQLGHRTVLATPTDRTILGTLARVSGALPWRPAAVIARHRAHLLWAETGALEPYGAGRAPLTEQGQTQLPAAAHRDGTVLPHLLVETGSPVAAILDALEAGGQPPVLLTAPLAAPTGPLAETTDQAVRGAGRHGLDLLVTGAAGEALIRFDRSLPWRAAPAPGARR
ncbi:carbamoyltransferase C-terminal domain-containing protein [Streptomyces xiamenensis]|uniref:carbamoyltransferase C-terminal domain-containing protein n=1 Tax=Streptomyces xiamenensis TaxID=408015 RepID=UPI0035DFBDA8